MSGDRSGRRVLLGVSGGIAAYKAAALASELVQRGDDVCVVLTAGAERFVGAATFAALTRRRVYTSLWDEPETIPHIALVREAGVLAIVPATANVLAKLARGIADDLLTNAALAARIPIVVAPAMNAAMYEHPATVENLRLLRSRGVTVVEPGAGFLAEREVGIGRLADQDPHRRRHRRARWRVPASSPASRGRHRGADARSRSTPCASSPTRRRGRWASNSRARRSRAAPRSTSCSARRRSSRRPARASTASRPRSRCTTRRSRVAAGADSRSPPRPSPTGARPSTFARKMKKDEGADAIALERTPDILAELGARKNGTFLVGFAAETENLEAQCAREVAAQAPRRDRGERRLRRARVSERATTSLTLLWGDDGRGAARPRVEGELARRMWDALLALRGAPQAANVAARDRRRQHRHETRLFRGVRERRLELARRGA